MARAGAAACARRTAREALSRRPGGASRMRMRHLKADNYRRQPWKNGGGFTTELMVEPDGDRWLWRLSIANVEQSGPFSDFAGYERTLMLLSGEGMELHFEEAPAMRIDRP